MALSQQDLKLLNDTLNLNKKALIRLLCICEKKVAYQKVKVMQSNQNPTPAPKPKREITNITNIQKTKRTYGQPSEQLFPKR